mmetsp:Transcript_56570/g.145658  ORF Transcript_56570/g.145658 Transcript_56570/m.145658 type:complete len:232 (-) Transcript_56570:409-1104(-)
MRLRPTALSHICCPEACRKAPQSCMRSVAAARIRAKGSSASAPATVVAGVCSPSLTVVMAAGWLCGESEGDAASGRPDADAGRLEREVGMPECEAGRPECEVVRPECATGKMQPEVLRFAPGGDGVCSAVRCTCPPLAAIACEWKRSSSSSLSRMTSGSPKRPLCRSACQCVKRQTQSSKSAQSASVRLEQISRLLSCWPAALGTTFSSPMTATHGTVWAAGTFSAKTGSW